MRRARVSARGRRGPGVVWRALRHGVLACGAALATASALFAQATGDSAQAATDSVPPRTTSGPDGRTPAAVGPDSVRGIDGGAAARTQSDTVPSAARPSAPAASPIPPPDSTLRRACAGIGAGALAPNLLVVMFRPGTPPEDRIAAARAVGGSLGTPTGSGEEYVQLTADAGPLPTVADRLIRQDPVTRVSPAPCPPAKPTLPGPTAPTRP